MNIALKRHGLLTTYLRASNALWRVCYGAKYPATQDPAGSITVDGNRYDITLVASGSQHLRFAIATESGDAETISRLEARLMCAYLDVSAAAEIGSTI